MNHRSAIRTAAAAVLVFFVLSFQLSAESPPFEGWLSTGTEHFRILYEPNDRSAAAELVTFAEDVYRDVTSYFERYPERITVILNGRTDDANGYFTQGPTRIVLFVAPPSDGFHGSRTENWLRFVFIHEFTHYMHLTDTGGFFGFLSLLAGEYFTTFTARFLPGWMIEGITTDRETEFTGGGRGRNELFEMSYKAPVIENRLFSLGQSAYSSSYPPSGRIYVAGYMLVHYLNSTYGDDTFSKIHQSYIAFPFFGPGAAVRKVTGKSTGEIFRDMEAFYEKKFAYTSAIEGGEQVSPDVWGNYSSPLAAGNSIYAYRSTFDSPPAVIRFDPETGYEEVLFQGRLFDRTSFTVDAGERSLVFAALSVDNRNPAGSEEISDLYRLDLLSGSTVRLTEKAHLVQPALSPDGDRLAAVKRNGSYLSLVEVDLRTGKETPLYAPEEASITHPVFSPDGGRIAFAMNVRGMQDIYILEFTAGTDTPTVRPLVTTDSSGDFYPRWKDGSTVLFSSDREGDLYLYGAEVSPDGSGPPEIRRVLRDPVGVLSAVPHGDGLLYAGYSSRGYTLKQAGPELLEAARVPVTEERTPEAYTWAEPAGEKPFRDFPKIYYHLPFLAANFYRDASGSEAVTFGLSYSVLGASYLRRYGFAASLEYYPEFRQPGGSGSFSVYRGPFSLNWEFQRQYRADYHNRDFYTDTINAVFLGYTFLDTADPFRQVFLGTDAGLQHVYENYSRHPFTAWEKPSWMDFSDVHLLLSSASVDFAWYRLEGRTSIDTFLPGFRTSAAVAVPFWSSAGDAEGFRLQTFTDVVLNGGVPHSFLKAGVRTVYQQGSSLGPFSLRPRGFQGEIDGRGETAGALTALDWIFQLPPLDLPLLFGFNLTRVNAGLHLEWEATLSPGGIDPGSYLYPGIETAFMIGFQDSMALPIGIGIAARIDLQDPGAFLEEPDLRPYIFLGFDSFIYGSRQTRPGGSWRNILRRSE